MSRQCDWPGVWKKVPRCTEGATRRVTIGVMAGSWLVCTSHAHALIDEHTGGEHRLVIDVEDYLTGREIARLKPRR
jgi:hypothetical protein